MCVHVSERERLEPQCLFLADISLIYLEGLMQHNMSFIFNVRFEVSPAKTFMQLHPSLTANHKLRLQWQRGKSQLTPVRRAADI